MKKIVSIVLSLMIVFPLFSCNNTNKNAVSNGIDYSVPAINIIENDFSDYRIVYSSTASSSQKFSAEELSSFLKQSTGVEISVINDNGLRYNDNYKYISIGKTNLLKGSDINFDYSVLNSDGFFIKRINNLIFIDGENDRGVLYGVYDFLEKFIGIKFLAHDYTYVPKVDKVAIPGLNIIEKPAFLFRNFLGNAIQTDALFTARARMSNELSKTDELYGGDAGWYKGSGSPMHNTLEYVDNNKYYQQYPEMFAVKSNKPVDICLTHGITEDGQIDKTMEVSAAKVLLETLKKRVFEEPNARFFMIGQMDLNDGYCRCGRCTSRLEKNGGRSGLMIIFFNAIAREIQQWSNEYLAGRKIDIINFAYYYSEMPPVKNDEVTKKLVPVNNLVITEDNLHIRIAPISADYYRSFIDEKQETKYKSMFQGWSVVTKNLMVWDYILCAEEYFWYIPSTRILKENYIFYESINVKYAMSQASYSEKNDFQADLQTYLASKLMWNPNQDANAIIDEFISLYYGMASKYVSEFINIMETHYSILEKNNPSFKANIALSMNNVYNGASSYPYQMLNRCVKLIETAINEVQASNLEQNDKNALIIRLTRVLICPQRMILKNIGAYNLTTSQSRELIDNFFRNTDMLGVKYYAEYKPISDLKNDFGAN